MGCACLVGVMVIFGLHFAYSELEQKVGSIIVYAE